MEPWTLPPWWLFSSLQKFTEFKHCLSIYLFFPYHAESSIFGTIHHHFKDIKVKTSGHGCAGWPGCILVAKALITFSVGRIRVKMLYTLLFYYTMTSYAKSFKYAKEIKLWKRTDMSARVLRLRYNFFLQKFVNFSCDFI